MLCTITDKEFPAAHRVLSDLGRMAEVDSTGAYTFADCLSMKELPFVLVQSAARANLFAGTSISKWIRQFRPQHFLITGTAGGIHRPVDDADEMYRWQGPMLGDVVVSEYVHYAEFMKVSSAGYLMRHLAMDQPSIELIEHARAVIRDGSWTKLSRSTRNEGSVIPSASIQEIVSGDAVQDDPTEPMQQFLMDHFDRAGAIEMESAGVAQSLHSSRESVHYAPGFVTIRGVSDIVYARGRARALTKHDLPTSTAGKTEERDIGSDAAASAAAAFAVALTTRLVRAVQPIQPGHRRIDSFEMPQPTELSDSADSVGV